MTEEMSEKEGRKKKGKMSRYDGRMEGRRERRDTKE